MKLSEAIARGARIAREKHMAQITGEVFDFDEDGYPTGCCALGAAVLGLKPDISIEEMANIQQNLPIFDYVNELLDDPRTAEDFDYVIGLNDGEGIGFDDIAARVEHRGW